jgi:hypothetical protein
MSKQAVPHQSTNTSVCEGCLKIAKYYYKTVDRVKKQIHREYHATFDKYFNLFSKFNKKVKADWILAYLKTEDYANAYHSDVLDNYIEELLQFHNMKLDTDEDTDKNVVIINEKRYYGHSYELRLRNRNVN